MRRLALVLGIATLVIAAPGAILAAAYPASGPSACARAGGEYSVDTSTSPDTKSCVVSLNNAGSAIYPGQTPAYTVQVSWSSDVIYYFAQGGTRWDIFFGGAIAITGCWASGNPVPNYSTNPNCQPA